MDGASFRTSVTVDEAVMILMGWADGPIELTPLDGIPSPAEQDCEDSWSFSLFEHLDGERATLRNAYDDSREDKLESDVIAERREAVRLFGLKVKQAEVCLCAVKDELNKEDASRLRIDRELSRRTVTYITRTSLDQWQNAEDVRAILAPAHLPGTTPKVDMPHSAKDDPWWMPKPGDPLAKQDWYIPARHFARALVKDDPTLLTKKDALAGKVVRSMASVGIYKRGGQLPFDPGTVKKAFSNVVF